MTGGILKWKKKKMIESRLKQNKDVLLKQSEGANQRSMIKERDTMTMIQSLCNLKTLFEPTSPFLL
jgi:hypothetical protein